VRNRYLDLLRAAAIVRVIVYHLFGWPWLSLLLPAMGVMFALAGSLAAASLEKRPAHKVVRSRLRRLLPPLWLLGLLAVPAMLAAGWAAERHGEHPFDARHLWHLAFWIFPLGDPPGSERAADLWDPLWYIRAYVWFILLSPLMYLAYRRIGWVAVIAPIAAIVVLDRTGFSLPDTADAAMWDFVTFGACWMTGFAHHDGRLRRLRPGTVVCCALVLGAAALYWQQGHQGEEPWDLNDVPESQALWSLAFVLLALRWEPSMTWLPRIRLLDRLVTLLNARAVTIYLWHNLAITAVWPVLSLIALGGVTFDDIGHDLDGPVDLSAALLLTLVAVLAFGWVEDLAARRRPRLWPTGAPALRRAEPLPEEIVPALVGAYPIGGGVPGPAPVPDPAGPAGLPAPADPAAFAEAADRAGFPELSDRNAGHHSAAAAMHRASLRHPVPWAADVPAIEGALGEGPVHPADGSTGAIRPVDGPAPAASIPPIHGPRVTGAIWPITGTDAGAPAGAAGPGLTWSAGRSRAEAAPPPRRGEIEAGNGWTDARALPRGGWDLTEATGGWAEAGESGRHAAAAHVLEGPPAAGRDRHPASGDGPELELPPGDWAASDRELGGGMPDWFRQRRGAPPDQTP
jgi:peptidoglycan/LPS O-acetylase OafA/YrhL